MLGVSVAAALYLHCILIRVIVSEGFNEKSKRSEVNRASASLLCRRVSEAVSVRLRACGAGLCGAALAEKSILFCSIMFYLFYSILFYSIFPGSSPGDSLSLTLTLTLTDSLSQP